MLYRSSLLTILMFVLSACDDLNPSSTDNRPQVDAGTIGYSIGQNAPDFALFDALENPVSLSAELTNVEGVVLYFTMWCPICDSHMSHMRRHVIPDFPGVQFYIVDYVSGTIALSRSSQLSNGFGGMDVLVDDSQYVLNLYHGTMGTTIVIDTDGVVRMNEDYRDGTALYESLSALGAF